jgi:hypothetical protein
MTDGFQMTKTYVLNVQFQTVRFAHQATLKFAISVWMELSKNSESVREIVTPDTSRLTENAINAQLTVKNVIRTTVLPVYIRNSTVYVLTFAQLELMMMVTTVFHVKILTVINVTPLIFATNVTKLLS